MILGRVVGEVWATRRHPRLGGKLLIVRPHSWYDPPFESGHVVAVDPVGAGVGEDVVLCLGEPARRALLRVDPALAAEVDAAGAWDQALSLPVDAAVMGIVDRVDLER